MSKRRTRHLLAACNNNDGNITIVVNTQKERYSWDDNTAKCVDTLVSDPTYYCGTKMGGSRKAIMSWVNGKEERFTKIVMG